jgi:hypothetical protein
VLIHDNSVVGEDRVTLSLSTSLLNVNAVVLIFVLQNPNPRPLTVNVSVSADLVHDSVSALADGRGFVAASSGNALTFICRDYSFVSDVATFWYGASSDRFLHNWTQVEVDGISQIDAAISFSWQTLVIPAAAFVFRSLIAKFGVLDPGRLTASFAFVFNSDGSVDVSFRVDSTHAPDFISVLFVADDDLSNVRTLSSQYPVNMDFTFLFHPRDYGLPVGVHRVSFFAVDTEGNIAPGTTATVAVHAEEEKAKSELVPILVAVIGASTVAAGVVAIFLYGRRHDNEVRIGGSSPGPDEVTSPALLDE